MTEEPNADRSPRTPSDEERLAAQRALSPRGALMDRLDHLEGGIPGAAAYQAAQRLLQNGTPSAGTLGARWNAAEGVWEVDHAAAMRLWSPSDGVGLPPAEMVDAFLTSYAERTGDDSERRLVEELYAEAEQQLSDQDGTPESSPESARAEAVAVGERYGYGELVEAIALDASPRTLGLALILAFMPAFFGTMLVVQSDGETLPVVGGIALFVVAAVVLAWGFVPLHRPRQVAPKLFVFRGGIVFGVNGLLDPYAWPDVELTETVVTSTVGSNRRKVREGLLMLGPPSRSARFLVPARHRATVAAVARAGGATTS